MRTIKFLLRLKLIAVVTAYFFIGIASGQTTFPVNGIADPSLKAYAFTNATIVKDANTFLQNATMIIRERKIVVAAYHARLLREELQLPLYLSNFR